MSLLTIVPVGSEKPGNLLKVTQLVGKEQAGGLFRVLNSMLRII